MPLESGTLFGRYEIRTLLGVGGMGEVYLADDSILRRQVALKLLPKAYVRDQDLQRRFRQEARAASSLNHPGILTIYDFGEESGTPFIAAEYVDGTTLRQRLREGPMPPDQALAVAVQVAAALAAAETAGIVHRDVKPENVMLRADGWVKVLDFGLAKRMPLEGLQGGATQLETMPNALVGTVRYMAPEQLRSEAVDSRADVWGVGLMLFEMLTGELPFTGRNVSDNIVSILTDPLPALAERCPEPLPAGLVELVTRALSREKESRVPSCAALHEELRRFVRGRASDEPPSSPSRPSGPWQEVQAALQSTPALKLPRARPEPMTAFVGREVELAALERLLQDPAVRLLTLTGPGGTGKTRLALALCRRVEESFPQGICFVPLASITDPDKVPAAIAAALGLPETAGVPVRESLRQALAARRLLLVLDNFEQLLPAAAAVTELLEASPAVKGLVTSRSLLHLQGEREFAVPPLAVPAPDDVSSAEDLDAYPSAALFLERARSAHPSLALDGESARAIAEICRRLEGLPLAIELAAARVRLLPPQLLLTRLTRRLGFLTGGAADLPLRHRTMRAALEWGHQILPLDEQVLFRRLCVFAGGFSLFAAEEVCDDPLSPLPVLDGVQALLEKSFLRRDERATDEPRFLMLEILNEFGRDRLGGSGEDERLRERHARHYAGLAEEAATGLAGTGQRTWLDRLEREHANLSAALEWTLAHGTAEEAQRLAGALWRFFYLRGHYAEGRRFLEAALSLGGPGGRAQARALVGAGSLAFLQCDYLRASELLERGRELARRLSDAPTLALALQFSGSVARERGEHARALALHRESLAVYRELRDERGEGHSLNYIGFAAWLGGDFEETERVSSESLALFRRLGDTEGAAWALLNLAAVAHYRRDEDKANALARESLALSAEAGYKEGVAWSLDILGNVAARRSASRAVPLLTKSLELHRELGDRWRMASLLDALARVAGGGADHAKAARLFGAAETLREQVGTPLPPVERPAWEGTLSAAREALGAERFLQLAAEGRHMPLERALALALADVQTA